MYQCIAKANVIRCLACFGFPFLALAAYVYKVSSVGDDLNSYWSKVSTEGLPFTSAVLISGGCLIWAVITWPKARMALRHRACAISLDEGQLNFYGEKLELEEIAFVDTVRRPFDFLLRIHRRDGSTVSRSIVLLNPSPELIAKRLQQAVL